MKRIRISIGRNAWALLEPIGITYNLGREQYQVMMVNRIPQLKVGHIVMELTNGWVAMDHRPLRYPLTVPVYRFPSRAIVEPVPTHGGEEE
jgi:hypothetical protein|tara:strand:- start:36223 stop:36495 length:273 start_codon:yes stop_codon:yes gene_type:complete